MPFVTPVPEKEAGPELKPIYEKIRNRFGFIPNYFQMQGRVPALAETQLEFREIIMRDGALPASLKAQLAVVVSGINTSSYCVTVHLELLREYGIEKSFGRVLANNYPGAPVDEKTQALFRFADKLTRRPFDICDEDAAALRSAGWSEDELFEAVLVVSLMNFANRFAIGVGLMADF